VNSEGTGKKVWEVWRKILPNLQVPRGSIVGEIGNLWRKEAVARGKVKGKKSRLEKYIMRRA